MNKMILYRAISEFEKIDYEQHKFRSSKNTLEGKQFFKSKKAVLQYVKFSYERDFTPSYKFVLEIEIDEECLNEIKFDEQDLDFYKAITIHEDYLIDFNKCLKFVNTHEVANYIHT